MSDAPPRAFRAKTAQRTKSGASRRSQRRADAQRRRDDLFGGPYRGISLRLSSGLLSIALFALSLTSRTWVRWLPWEPVERWQRPLMAPAAILALSIVGLLLALFGRWRDRGSQTARIALWLHGGALVTITLAVAAIAAIFALR